MRRRFVREHGRRVGLVPLPLERFGYLLEERQFLSLSIGYVVLEEPLQSERGDVEQLVFPDDR